MNNEEYQTITRYGKEFTRKRKQMNNDASLNIRINSDLLNKFNDYCMEHKTNKSKLLVELIQKEIGE